MDAGLEQVVAAETVLSDVDGENGRLVIRGHELSALAGRVSFEEVIHLLWQGFFADLPPPDQLKTMLGEARLAASARVKDLPSGLSAIETLRAGLSLLGDGDDLNTALRFTAGAAVMTAAAIRKADGKMPIAPDAALSHASDFLRMMRGAPPSPAEAASLDRYLVTISDHGLNASTFAARVVASTAAGIGSAVIAGLSALKGPLHGGAPGPVLDMLDAIGTPAAAESFIDAAMARGERLMGFGHRIYRVRDPRADALKAALKLFPQNAGRVAFAEEIERTAIARLRMKYPARALDTNVEFYTALLLEALGVPRVAFTPLFAMGRVAGWIAHAREQAATKRLIRPRSLYVGPRPRAAA